MVEWQRLRQRTDLSKTHMKTIIVTSSLIAVLLFAQTIFA